MNEPVFDDFDASPVRRGRHVGIRPVRPEDYATLYEIALFTDAGGRWRLHGETPTMDQFLQILFREARATFVIESVHDSTTLGMVQLWAHDPMNRNGHITAFLHPSARGRGWPLEGLILFADYVFSAFALHKLYFETLATELAQFRSLIGTAVREEGHLRDHRWAFGRLVDCHVLALYASELPLLTRLIRGPEQVEQRSNHTAAASSAPAR